MSEQLKVKVRWSDQGYLEAEAGTALYICEIHRGCGYVPFFDAENPNWGGPLNEWIAQWEPLIAELDAGEDEELQKHLNTPLLPRPDGSIQATFRAYQLYTFNGAAAAGEVRGYWQFATPDLPDADEEHEDCPDFPGGPFPPNPRGP